MNSSSWTEFTRADGRRFAFPVGTAFALLAGILMWRDRPSPAGICFTLAGSLYLAGLVAPARLGPVYRAWMALAGVISKVTTPVFMGIVYFGVLTPTGLVMRAAGKNPIMREPKDGSYWLRTEGKSGHSDLRRQF